MRQITKHLNSIYKQKNIITTAKMFQSTLNKTDYFDGQLLIEKNISGLNKLLKSAKNLKEDSQWRELEANVINNIHYLNADNYVDVLSTFAHFNKGSEIFWDLLSRKIYDYDLDIVQCLALDEALDKTSKYDSFILYPLTKKLQPLLASYKDNQLVNKFRI